MMTNEQRVTLYQSVFNTPNGRKVMEDLQAYCNADRSAFATDALEMAKRCGKQDVFFFVLNITQKGHQ